MKLQRRRTRELGLLLGMLCILSACAGKISSVGTSEGTSAPLFCAEARPIVFSRLHDTLETIKQVKAHNAVGIALCGWKAPQ